MQKALMGRCMTMPKLPQQEYIFAGKATARASTSILRLMQSAALQKSIAQEDDVRLVNGAPLQRVNEVE
jgi:hypothetical protein